MKPGKEEPQVIGQELIVLILGFEDLIRQRQGFYARLYQQALDLLRSGASVEKGAHTIELGPGAKYLVIDGVPRIEFMPSAQRTQ